MQQFLLHHGAVTFLNYISIEITQRLFLVCFEKEITQSCVCADLTPASIYSKGVSMLCLIHT